MQLPRSMEGEDLVEVFGITGHVELAETPFGGTRSKGCSVVQFSQARGAWATIGRCCASSSRLQIDDSPCWKSPIQRYMEGSRPMDMHFDEPWWNFLPLIAQGGQVLPVQADR
ncbi:hypothetical protein F5141DRAFT_470308 [Pisolithus sp. B1]|nr:hypothetical protein F5141DRAFT_470308 [Pisolithus sp. B1]